VLDAGVGAGQFADVVSRGGKLVVYADLGCSADAAVISVELKDTIDLMQVDLYSLPFRLATFNVMPSFGMLHHTLDTRHRFMHLIANLRPGGTTVLWLYDGNH
jgi:SAM-dependent methyltransferase